MFKDRISHNIDLDKFSESAAYDRQREKINLEQLRKVWRIRLEPEKKIVDVMSLH